MPHRKGQTNKPSRSKYAYLMTDLRVQNWYNELALGSTLTADNYVRRLGQFIKENQLKTLEGFLVLTPSDRAQLLRNRIQKTRDPIGAAPGVTTMRKGIISFLKFVGMKDAQKAIEEVSTRGAHVT